MGIPLCARGRTLRHNTYHFLNATFWHCEAQLHYRSCGSCLYSDSEYSLQIEGGGRICVEEYVDSIHGTWYIGYNDGEL